MASYASGFQKTPGGWDWPDDVPGTTPTPRSTPQAAPSSSTTGDGGTGSRGGHGGPKHYRPRTCRICLETVLPTFHPPSEHLPEMLQGPPTVTYDSEGGRLVRPCKCKGSAKYVHEACLQEWRHADPGYARRNYYNCPTCGFKYRLGRVGWANWIRSTVTQLALTVSIFLFAVFVMGFIADPIINMYLDPVSTIASTASTYNDPFQDMGFLDDDDEDGWVLHFFKGFASLGLLGFIKVFFSLGPWGWFNMRHYIGGGGGVRTGNTGRDRLANVSWLVVFLGVCTFLYTVWKVVRAWSRRVLEKASESVMDVQGDDGEDDDD